MKQCVSTNDTFTKSMPEGASAAESLASAYIASFRIPYFSFRLKKLSWWNPSELILL